MRGRAEPLSASVRMSLRATPSARSVLISDRIAWLAWFWASTSVAPVPWVENEIVPWSGRMVTDPLPVKRMNGCSMPLGLVRPGRGRRRRRAVDGLVGGDRKHRDGGGRDELTDVGHAVPPVAVVTSHLL